MNAPLEHPRGKRASLFKSNRNQAVRIPKEMEFPEGIKQVYVHKQGRGLVIIPVSDFWDSFFDRPGMDIVEPAELPFDTREAF